MPAEISRFRAIQTATPLSGHMHPFHRDSQNHIPSFITNGSVGKAPFAIEAGLPLLRSQPVKEATSLAEDEYHRSHGNGVIGPAMVDCRPYPLTLAIQKLLAARRVLADDGNLESFFAQDATYGVTVKGTDIDVTIHKPKGPEDVDRLISFMREAASSGQAEIASMVGLARWDEKAQTVEAYTARTVLGTLREFDTAILANRLNDNGHISMGTPTYEVFDYLVDRPPMVQTVVHKYTNGEVVDPQFVAGCIRPQGRAIVETSTDSNLLIHLAGLGFFKR